MWIVYAIYLVVFIALTAAAYLLTPKPKNQNTVTKPDKVDIPVAEIGTKLPVVFGTRMIDSPNLVWYGNVRIEEIKKEVSGKKK